MDFLVKAFKAAGNHHRLRLLRAVWGAKKACRQADLVRELSLSQHLGSRYLSSLADAGLIDRFRSGLAVCYRKPRKPPAAIRRLGKLVADLPSEFFGIDSPLLERLKG